MADARQTRVQTQVSQFRCPWSAWTKREKKKKNEKKNTQAPESLRPLATSWHYSLCLHVLWTQICLSSHQLSETSALTTTGLFSLQHSTKKLEQLSRKTWVYERSETVSNGEGASLGHGHEGGSNLMPCASQVVLSDSAPPVLCKHGKTVPLRLRWSGYASLSETNGHIMTQARWLMSIPASSLALLLYHVVPPCTPYFCLLAPITSVQRHFIGIKYTFLTILHITRETKNRA